MEKVCPAVQGSQHVKHKCEEGFSEVCNGKEEANPTQHLDLLLKPGMGVKEEDCKEGSIHHGQGNACVKKEEEEDCDHGPVDFTVDSELMFNSIDGQKSKTANVIKEEDLKFESEWQCFYPDAEASRSGSTLRSQCSLQQNSLHVKMESLESDINRAGNAAGSTPSGEGEKPHCCSECGKQFSHRCTLLRHTRIHTGEKLYSCFECGRKFLQRNHLESHTSSEFASMLSSYSVKHVRDITLSATDLRSAASKLNLTSIDYRKLGYVTPVQDQGTCGCCWAFSAAGAIEGQTFNKTGKLIPLSKQNLLDCAEYLGNQGCTGSRPSLAFQYVIDNGGIQAEATYPYKMAIGSCRFNSSKVAATVANYKYLPIGNEQALADALATIGPISVAIDARQISFQFYLSGRHTEECPKAITVSQRCSSSAYKRIQKDRRHAISACRQWVIQGTL
ncbi:CATS protein, partial [Polypterus senegalus]